jgi:hypothetical protein
VWCFGKWETKRPERLEIAAPGDVHYYETFETRFGHVRKANWQKRISVARSLIIIHQQNFFVFDVQSLKHAGAYLASWALRTANVSDHDLASVFLGQQQRQIFGIYEMDVRVKSLKAAHQQIISRVSTLEIRQRVRLRLTIGEIRREEAEEAEEAEEESNKAVEHHSINIAKRDDRKIAECDQMQKAERESMNGTDPGWWIWVSQFSQSIRRRGLCWKRVFGGRMRGQSGSLARPDTVGVGRIRARAGGGHSMRSGRDTAGDWSRHPSMALWRHAQIDHAIQKRFARSIRHSHVSDHSRLCPSFESSARSVSNCCGQVPR